MMKVNNIRVVEAAAEPGAPIRPRVSVNVVSGAAAGSALGLVFAWVREQLDNSLKTPDDLEQRLGVTFLGLLPEIEDGRQVSLRAPAASEAAQIRLPTSRSHRSSSSTTAL